MKIRLLTAVLAILCSTAVFGQKAALKTNLLYDAGLTLNGGIEFRMAPKWTFDLSANLNALDHRQPPLEALAGSARSPLLALSGVVGPLLWCASARRPVQLGTPESAV